MKATHNPPIHDTTNQETTPADLLRGAALYLWRHGWTRGEFFDLLDDQPFPRACALGAINISAHGRPILCSDDGSQDADSDAAIRAMRVFAAHLDSDYAAGVIDVSAIDIVAAFNDDPATTLEQVVDALTDAATDWEAGHPHGGVR